MKRNLRGVEDTLYIPLVARIYVSKRFPNYFYDEKALGLEKDIPNESIEKYSSEYQCMASAARYFNLDRIVKEFIKEHPSGNIIYLGAGLETAYYRIQNETAKFYQIDLPEVIDLRESILGAQKNEKLIGCDMFNINWKDELDTTIPTLIIASGVFQYFHEDEILNFIRTLKSSFRIAYLVFDATNSTGLKYANKFVKKTGNINAKMYFAVDDINEFSKKAKIKVIDERIFFSEARKSCKTLGLYSKIAMKITDDKKRLKILYFKLN